MSRAPRAVGFLDDSPGNRRAQQTIVRNLRDYKVPVNAMIVALKNMEIRRLLVMEQRAAERDRLHPNAGRALFHLEQALGLAPPDTPLEEATYFAFTVADSVCQARAQQAPVRYARQRQQLQDRGDRRIAPGARLSAIQQRFMPEVRRVVWTTIHRALLKQRQVHVRTGHVFAVHADTRVYHDQDSAAADDLTARFITTFFPSWGSTTTPELVRKARKSSRRRA